MKNIKIEIQIELSKDDIETLNEQIELYSWDGQKDYIAFETKDLLVDFATFLLPWIDQWYSFEWDKNRQHYIIY